jgi:hypothetical protein
LAEAAPAGSLQCNQIKALAESAHEPASFFRQAQNMHRSGFTNQKSTFGFLVSDQPSMDGIFQMAFSSPGGWPELALRF